MKSLFRLCAGVVLTLAFAVPSFAGQIPCPVTEPPPEERTAATTSETKSAITETVITLMQSMLTVF